MSMGFKLDIYCMRRRNIFIILNKMLLFISLNLFGLESHAKSLRIAILLFFAQKISEYIFSLSEKKSDTVSMLFPLIYLISQLTQWMRIR